MDTKPFVQELLVAVVAGLFGLAMLAVNKDVRTKMAKVVSYYWMWGALLISAIFVLDVAVEVWW